MRRASRLIPLLLAAVLASAAGCFPIPMPMTIQKGPTTKGFTKPTDLPDFIKVDRTTRAEVIAMLGEPFATAAPDQLIYEWDVTSGYIVAAFAFQAVEDKHAIRARLEFDPQQVLRGYDLRERPHDGIYLLPQHHDIYTREGDVSPEPSYEQMRRLHP
jgi:hypothetical protein